MSTTECEMRKAAWRDHAWLPGGLAVRRLQPERMDDPALDGDLHLQALRGLSRLNSVGSAAQLIWPGLRSLSQRLRRDVRVLDIATGGGDVPLALWRIARRQGLPIKFTGCDLSPRAIGFAQAQADAAAAPITFFQHDVLKQPLPTGYDAVICSLFLHHLERPQAIELLRRMAGACGSLVIVSDLLRTPSSWLLTYAASRVLTRSPIVHADGPMSVAAAFSFDEARALAVEAGMLDATVRHAWPCRFMLLWSQTGIQN